MKLEINCETGEELLREFTKEEIAQQKKDDKSFQAEETAKAQQAAERAALLARLGLTEDELKTILG